MNTPCRRHETTEIEHMLTHKTLKWRLDCGYNSMHRLLIRFVVSGLVGMCSQVALANSPSPAVKEACGAEIRSLCVRPWRLSPDSINQCARQNREKLSPACQIFWDTAQMCQAEMKNICGGLNPLTIKSCLRDSIQEFSKTCQDTLDL